MAETVGSEAGIILVTKFAAEGAAGERETVRRVVVGRLTPLTGVTVGGCRVGEFEGVLHLCQENRQEVSGSVTPGT